MSKRAANRCSNPDCCAVTSGPAANPSGSINVGEAAHIYGAHPGSARFEPEMPAIDRSAITNAIWLCGNCHKMVDDDETRFPAGLLFEWQKNHERQIAIIIGKAGAEVRQKWEARHLEEFGRLSYLAERIITEKPALWEYRLTSEVLRFEMTPILQRWDALKRGLYMRPVTRIAVRDFGGWISDRASEARRIFRAFDVLMNEEFHRVWGEPGVPGSDAEIVTTCRLFSGMCSSALEWEETVRFVTAHEAVGDVIDLFPGVAGGMIDEAAKVPAFIADTLNEQNPTGMRYLNLRLTVPDGWSDQVEAGLARVLKGIESGEISY